MPDEMIPFVSNDAAGYEVFMGRWTNRLAGPFLEFAGVGRGQRVLDVGCGTGVITCASWCLYRWTRSLRRVPGLRSNSAFSC